MNGILATEGLRRGRMLVLTLGLIALFAFAAATPALAQVAAAKSVRVTAGKPSEFGFVLSTHTVALGSVVFTITNRGVLSHSFKVCSSPRTKATANTCNGKGSRTLSPGQSVKLTVKFTKKGSYEYLCTVSGHAANGMKGILKAV